MSGQCLCSWCVEARQRARDAETADLRALAAYDQARSFTTPEDRDREALYGRWVSDTAAKLLAEMRAISADISARQRREARERAGASCP